MHEQHKRDANDHQIQTYFTSYDRFWRLNKLLLIKNNLESREELKDVFRDFYGKNYLEYENFVYENITNGLIADAISETVMLCEDYFGILKLIRERHYFVKRIVTYRAGTITAIVDKLKKLNGSKLRTLFFIPDAGFIETNFARGNAATANSEIKTFNQRLQMLQDANNEAVSFYESNIDTYNLYKHGLKLCLNGLGQGLSAETIEERKNDLSADIWKFDNKNQRLTGMVIPNIGPIAIRNNAAELLKERNLLHLGIMNHMHIDHLIYIAKKILNAITILVANRTALINRKNSSHIEVWLPSENSERMKSVVYRFFAFPNYPIPTINDYHVKL